VEVADFLVDNLKTVVVVCSDRTLEEEEASLAEGKTLEEAAFSDSSSPLVEVVACLGRTLEAASDLDKTLEGACLEPTRVVEAFSAVARTPAAVCLVRTLVVVVSLAVVARTLAVVAVSSEAARTLAVASLEVAKPVPVVALALAVKVPAAALAVEASAAEASVVQ